MKFNLKSYLFAFRFIEMFIVSKVIKQATSGYKYKTLRLYI